MEKPRKVDRNRSDQEAAAAAAARGGKRRPCVRFVEEGAVACAMEARANTCVTLNDSGIQLAMGPQPLRLRNHNFGLAQRIMVKHLATSPHDPLGITDSACKNQLVVVSVQYGPFNPYIPIRSTTIGKSRVARDPITMHTSWRSNSDITSVTSTSGPKDRACSINPTYVIKGESNQEALAELWILDRGLATSSGIARAPAFPRTEHLRYGEEFPRLEPVRAIRGAYFGFQPRLATTRAVRGAYANLKSGLSFLCMRRDLIFRSELSWVSHELIWMRPDLDIVAKDGQRRKHEVVACVLFVASPSRVVHP
ncbi:rho guanine nucleotide exchange factor 8-like [Dorcoceras hygrometricum]|uniref:Rho guanine nucleotide exchange factor 8-like n=1 Tax=Dorcoceras hygrometricum TaxID=472368 RepID=A0A2Z7DGY7_9LAMI|nr:rho guanine nucleotide exchange factor 8-like [Dorcoceras hygrometricum]